MVEVGFRYPEFSHRVRRSKAEEFAHAIGDDLRRLPDGRLEAPIGSIFFVTVQDSGSVFGSFGAGWSDVLFGGLRLDYRRPVAVGDELIGSSVVAAYREVGDAARRLGLCDLRTEYRDPTGELVLEEVSTLVLRLTSAPATPASPPAASAANPLGQHECEVNRMRIAWMAVAISDPNPIHVEDDIARSAGFPSVIAHGTFAVGAVGAAVGRRFGAGRVRRVALRLTAPSFPGDLVRAEVAPGPDARSLQAFVVAGARLLAQGSVESASAWEDAAA